MSINRVRIARDKGEFVQSLVNFNQGIGPFQTYADVIAFAAALGVRYQERVAIENVAKEPSPISRTSTGDANIFRGHLSNVASLMDESDDEDQHLEEVCIE